MPALPGLLSGTRSRHLLPAPGSILLAGAGLFGCELAEGFDGGRKVLEEVSDVFGGVFMSEAETDGSAGKVVFAAEGTDHGRRLKGP